MCSQIATAMIQKFYITQKTTNSSFCLVNHWLLCLLSVLQEENVADGSKYLQVRYFYFELIFLAKKFSSSHRNL